MSEVNEEKVAEMRAKLEEINERRRELLRKVVEVAEHALAHQPENVRECWCHFNAAQLALRQMMRPKPNTLAFVNEKWWYKENDAGTGLGAVDPAAGSGAFFTPKEVLEDPALKVAVEPTEKPLDPNAPEMVRGGEPDEKKDNGWHPLEIPESGIYFKRYYSPDCEVYICAWQNKDNSIGHVYEIRLRRTDDGWRAVLSNDGLKLCSLAATGRNLANLLSIGAMRAYLRRGHRKTISKAEKAAAALADARSDAAEQTNH